LVHAAAASAAHLLVRFELVLANAAALWQKIKRGRRPHTTLHTLAVAFVLQVQFLTTGGGTVRFNPNLYDCGKVRQLNTLPAMQICAAAWPCCVHELMRQGHVSSVCIVPGRSRAV
jgi:hypothetical protein